MNYFTNQLVKTSPAIYSGPLLGFTASPTGSESTLLAANYENCIRGGFLAGLRYIVPLAIGFSGEKHAFLQVWYVRSGADNCGQ